MPTNISNASPRTLAALAASALAATPSPAAEAAAVDDLIARIKSVDDGVRGPAWQDAARFGAPAVKPLAATMAHDDFETARSAKRALWVIVRHAGRPGAGKESKAVTKELIALLGAGPAVVRREVAWMLSEIAGEDAIAPMAALLADKDLRADALCALMRFPGGKATAAIAAAFTSAPEDFKFALADSLRKRGEQVAGYPTQKLTPSRKTNVTYQPPAPAPSAAKTKA